MNVRLALVCLLLSAACCAAQSTRPAERMVLYVAPTGSDASPGTPDKPFATIAHARDAVRQMKARDKDGSRHANVLVILRGGVYTLSEPIVFSVQDSGDANQSITYMSAPGETAVISGAPVLKLKWAPAAPSARPASNPGDQNTPSITVWTAQLPPGTWFQDLYVNGKPEPRCRVPDSGFLKARDLDQSKTQFGFDPAKVATELQGKLRAVATIRTWEWDEEQLPVAAIDLKEGKITLAHAASYPIVPKGHGVAGEFALANVPGAIHMAHEWAIDGNGVLTYALPPGIDPATLEFRGASNAILFDVHGDAAKAQHVENLHFQGLAFQQTGRIEKIEWGQYQGQAIRFQDGVRDCSIRGCTFHDLGGGGITLWRRCRGITVDGNEFHDVGDDAVNVFDYLGEGPCDSGGDTIINNTIHDCGVVRHTSDAISISGADSNLVAHNLIYNMPYIGICVNGVMPTSWQQKFEPSLQPPFTADKIKPFVRTQANRIEFNCIHDVMRTMADGGAIYFWGTMGVKPNFVTANLIERVGLPDKIAVGIYMDDWTDDVQIRDNVVVKANWGLHLHGAPRITVENNLFAYSRAVDCSVQPEKYNTGPLQSVIRHNIFYAGLGKLTHEWTAWDRHPLAEMNFNCWFRPGEANLKLGFGQGFDKDSITTDPQLIDPGHPQAGLKATSPAFKIGFKAIDLSTVGPQTTTLPSTQRQ